MKKLQPLPIELRNPVMYKGWLIKTTQTNEGLKLGAMDMSTGKDLSPLYNTWEQLKSIIDALK